MKRSILKTTAGRLLSAAGALLCTSALFAGASAQAPAPHQAPAPRQSQAQGDMQLCVFSSGRLNLDKSILQNGASGKVQIPVGFYLIRHPKGNILFDTGNNDRIINEPNYWGPLIGALDPERTPEIAIDAQLSRVNVRPDDVRYVVLGHFHADHAGNVGKFPNSTIVYQRDDLRAAFWPAPGYATFYLTGDFGMLRSGVAQAMPARQPVIELDGDLDLLGDGSVLVHRTVSHTPGSQMLVVRLPQAGTVVLTSDAVYLKENLERNLLPSVGSVYDPTGMLDAYAWVRRLRDTENATVMYAHDPDEFKSLRHAPDCYS